MTLSRLQSGTGALNIRLLPSPQSGDMALGCLYQFEDGSQGVMQVSGEAFGTQPDQDNPLLWLSHRARGQGAVVDLRQVRKLRRLLLFIYSPSRTDLTGEAVLTIETFAHAHIEVPIDTTSTKTLVLLTAYVVDGEIVLRAEMQTEGSTHDAASAFGYDIAGL